MVFSSLFFLYLFLPLNLVVYYFAKTTKARNIVMLIFSLTFYAWGAALCFFACIYDGVRLAYISIHRKTNAARRKGKIRSSYDGGR